MKVLVIGNGGREHALAWKLLQSPRVEQCWCVPGNGGTALLEGCKNIPLAVEDIDGIAQVALQNQVDLVVVGPEVTLSLGISDLLQQEGIPVFGPTQLGAKIESSKSWAKTLMAEAGVPIAQGETFSNAAAAKAYITQQGTPIVVKADGLAAGKGVIVAQTVPEAYTAVDDLFKAGFSLIVVEECLIGEEVSILALTDGITVRSLLPAQDHKRIGDGDTGLNTGGMGAYCPAPIATPDLLQRVDKEILQPTVTALRNRGIDYRGVLYAGLMVSPQGEPKVLEYNCRFGDPETQAVLPLLKTPLDQVILACVQQRLGELPPLRWRLGTAVCVVAVSAGYPGQYEKGKLITGIQEAEAMGVTVFQAGTALEGDRLVTDGGRVLGVTAIRQNFSEAIIGVYQGVDCIDFEGKYYRRDIGHRARSRKG
ncbi:phosphoribosylamine--glycine ligase [cyanobacterium endosymbiont of Epithemia clementina EcSB]|uniref:phosphoribosylamine--glycine ligase n=1 Tax=cyanobacterium endosymbiont of Epithemia clementina EcSB TaxID=3034674 RepID=UPI002480CB38|nr:phosphoribosylamine--glycine ligase [cyanobacterium endosymbiont of Epithemia clementina EcSB]WGT66809.1 phosphoribosylamine--glycine ligase [cyanobacterium endosymbiont of Epithemia clementina EcSB]